MMNLDELQERGAKFFDALHPDDKRALKHFITGQIQNILSNEHGVGGSRNLRGQVERSIEKIANGDAFIDRVANRVLYARRSIDIDKLIKAAVEKAASDAVEKVVGAAASRIKVNVFVEPDAPDDAQPAHFGRF